MVKDNESATIKLLPKQTEAWDFFEDKDTTEVGYGGAAGGGKTRLGWYLAIHIAESFPGSRGVVARKELKTLRLTTLAELFLIFQELGYKKDRDYRYNAQDNVIKFPNGSEIVLVDTAVDTQDPEYTKFGSLNITWCWIEESNESPEKALSILKTRIGRNNKFVIAGKTVEIKPFWLETFNPNKGHVYRNYYKPYKESKLPAYRKFIPALPGDNPYLLDSYLKQLERADKTTRERLLKGNFDYDNDPMKIMQYEAIVDLRSNTLPEKERGKRRKYLINDIARFGGDKIVLAEFDDMTLIGLEVNTYQDTEQTKQDIKDRAKESQIPFSQIISDEGGVGGGVVDGLKGTKGFNGSSRPRTIQDPLTGKDIAENYSNLRSQCYFLLSEFVNRHDMAIDLQYFKTNIEGFTMEMALEQLEEELDAVKQVPPTGAQSEKKAIIGKPLMKEDLGRSPDFADVFMMRMFFELKQPRDITPPKVRIQGGSQVIGGGQVFAQKKTAINKAY